jgi:F-type H+-transporting ATPase subunit delta
MAAVAQLYARAFADVADKDGIDLEAALSQLQAFGAAFAESHDLRELMGNPSVPIEQKIKVLDAICARIKAGKQVRNFLAILLQKGRMAELKQVLAETQLEIDRRNHVVEAEIATVTELNAKQKHQLEARVAKLAGKGTVRAKYRQDATLLGGVTIKIGSTVYDGSVAGQFRRLKEQLTAQ